MKLTKADKALLSYAVRIQWRHGYGVFPRGASQHRQFRKLVRRGLLKFDAWGVDGFRESIGPVDVAIHRITKKGIAALPEALASIGGAA